MLFRTRFRTRMRGFLPMRFLLDRRTSWLRPFRMGNRGYRSCLRLDRTRMLHFMLFRTRRGLRHGVLSRSLWRMHGLLLPWFLPWHLRLVLNRTLGMDCCGLVVFSERPWHSIFSG